MDGRMYDGWATPAVAQFTKEQRQRAEALTLVRKLTNSDRQPADGATVHHWLTLAEYIVVGKS